MCFLLMRKDIVMQLLNSGLQAWLSLKADHTARLPGAHSLNILRPKPVAKAFTGFGPARPASLG
jgi:hypothetical protein